MKLLRAFIANSVFSLNILLIFLVLFRDGLEVPVWLQPVGRMHPLLLHLPIGLFLLATLMILFRKGFKKKAFHNFLNFVLYFSALTAVITAIMGLLLSREGGYDETQLNLHLFSGTAVSLCTASQLWLSLYFIEKTILFNASLAFSTFVLLIAGHLGSILTHGENFILQPLAQQTNEAITDSTSLYEAAVQPVLKAKCMSCHNARKVKGDLNMTSVDKIAKGGKHGPVWVAGNPDSSEMIIRIQLPEQNDDHMPPAGKTQLTKSEMDLLYRWIQAGADLVTPWTKFKPTDTLSILAAEFIRQQQTPSASQYAFPFASKETIQKLNTPYCTVVQLALNEPALKADFFLSQAFNAKSLEDLLAVKEQLVNLNLAKMPVTDATGKILAQFKNLERLNLNQTAVTGNILPTLKDLNHLKSISFIGTAIDAKSLGSFANLASLKEVFLWNTKILPAEKAQLQKQYPAISWDQGYPSAEILRLTPPLLVNENLLLARDEGIHLKHNLPGTQIRYTLDGTDPDSTSGAIYKEPIPISKYTFLKARAFKDGWYSSALSQFYFFKQGTRPLHAELLNPPDPTYKGEGAATLIDTKKGAADNLRDVAWLGYHDKPLIAVFTMNGATKINTVTVSYCEPFSDYIMPPASVELWGGEDPTRLKLLERIVPEQPKEYGPRNVKGVVFNLPASREKYFKIVAAPIAKLPKWISAKQEKGWLFVDEVIFNSEE